MKKWNQPMMWSLGVEDTTKHNPFDHLSAAVLNEKKFGTGDDKYLCNECESLIEYYVPCLNTYTPS